MDGKILIGCRDSESRKLLMNVFSGRGLKICTVLDDADFLLEVLDHDYQAIIYDIEMSAFDGLKMVKIIRKVRPKVSLVVLSNNTCKEIGGKILQEGIIHYAVKPIHPETIEQAVIAAMK